MTGRLYREDPYLLEFEAEVQETREHQARPAVVLDKTAFYPEGGGQPSDTGFLSEVRVLSVLEEKGVILHVLSDPLSAKRVRGRVDGERRRHNREQHHGQHLLSRAFVEVCSARTVSVHLGEEGGSVDLDREISAEEVRAATDRANTVVWGAHPVRTRIVSRAEALALGLSPTDEAGDQVRLVEAEGFDLQPCGGTHPRSTAEVGLILPLGQERYKGGTRVRFVCGHRAFRVACERIEIGERLGQILSSPPEGLVGAAERLKVQLADSDRRSKELLERSLRGEAVELLSKASGSPPVVVARYSGWAPDDLRALANEIVKRGAAIVLLGSAGEKAHLVFAQSEGLSKDIPGLLREAAAALGGKGGGTPRLAQGGGSNVERLQEVLDAAAAKVKTP